MRQFWHRLVSTAADTIGRSNWTPLSKWKIYSSEWLVEISTSTSELGTLVLSGAGFVLGTFFSPYSYLEVESFVQPRRGLRSKNTEASLK